MSAYVSENLRNLVAKRAAFRCEYCLVPDIGSFINFQIDHIRSVKHGGLSTEDNLAFCCPNCNRYKGTDLGTRLGNDVELTPFFNPRTDNWSDHFEFENGVIYSKTKMGEATIVVFQMNTVERILERLALFAQGRYRV
jgi:hypothetical protein